MERLLWHFNIFGIQVGWAMDKDMKRDEFFESHPNSCMFYIGKLRFWNYYKYYKQDE